MERKIPSPSFPEAVFEVTVLLLDEKRMIPKVFPEAVFEVTVLLLLDVER